MFQLMIVSIVQDVEKKKCLETVQLKTKNSNIVVKIVVKDL